MCGICGVYGFKNSVADKGVLTKMTDALVHRGPDGSGYFINGPIGLGHRRLSIIDISGGAQPITNEDNSLQLIFNGEIYNYIELREVLISKGHLFKTKSDTEVIIHAYEEYGVDCVKNFNGIFAFALWDSIKERLFIARDHLGVKPVYYTVLNETLYFASEIKSLLTDQKLLREVDMDALGSLFTYRYVPSPDTLFNNIKKLPPGSFLIADKNGLSTKRFWTRLPQIVNKAKEKDLKERYQELLEDAVRLQLRSDVPVGLFLSSGIDSGSILALMRKHNPGAIHTFTIGFENGEKTNENDDARIMADRYGTDHNEMIVSPHDYEEYYSRYLWDLEEPVGNETAAAFYFVSKIAKEKVKVVLSGQGADEPWAGYHRHLGARLSSLYSHFPRFLTENILPPLVSLLPGNERLKRGVLSLNEKSIMERFIKIYSFYSSEMKKKLFQPWVIEEIELKNRKNQTLQKFQSEVAHLDALSQMVYMDTRTNLPDDLLMVSDKTSMANSIEARVPFLDYRLIEFIETLPPDLKLRWFKGKYLHKKALEKWLPREMIYRKKKGFANPIETWFKKRMSTYVNECLLAPDSATGKYFNQDYIKEMIKHHASGRESYMRHINLLIAFELWHRQFIGNAP